MFVNCAGSYGARLVTFLCVLEAVGYSVAGGEARGRGVGSVLLARGCSLSRSGRHGEDMDAGDKGISLCNSRRV